jgi:ATP-dependent DNA ligase
MNSFITYKSKIASRYIPVDATQIGIKIPESDYYMTSIKFDGHLTFLIVKNNTIQLLDRNGEELKIEKITKSASIINDNCVLVGELCAFQDNKPTSHREVNQAISQPEKFDLRFGAFDILELNGKELDIDLDERLKKLNEMLIKGKEVFPINQNYFESRKDIIEFFKTSTNQNTEGVIVKTPNGITYKIKQIHHLDLVVLGYAESTGEKEDN